MPLSRNTIGTVVVVGALGATLVAPAYPAMLGVQNKSSDPARIIANTQWGRSPRLTATSS